MKWQKSVRRIVRSDVRGSARSLVRSGASQRVLPRHADACSRRARGPTVRELVRPPSRRGKSTISTPGNRWFATRRKTLRPWHRRSARYGCHRGQVSRSSPVGSGSDQAGRWFSVAPQGAGESHGPVEGGDPGDVEKRQRSAVGEVKAAPAARRGRSFTRSAARRRSPPARAGAARRPKGRPHRVSLGMSIEAGPVNNRPIQPCPNPRERNGTTEDVHAMRRCAVRVVCTRRTRSAKSARST